MFPVFITKLLYDKPNLKEDEKFKIKISSLIAGVKLFNDKGIKSAAMPNR
jgi:hypothetical protein